MRGLSPRALCSLADSVTAPSHDALLALLTELARSGPSAERLAKAREDMRALGAPKDLEGAPLLVWAVRWNDLEMVELLLGHGAGTFVLRGEPLVRLAHAQGRPMLDAIRRAARAAAERSPAPGLAIAEWERHFSLRTDRGVAELRRSARALDVLLVASDLKSVARALGNLVHAPRREADVATRPVQDAHRLVFLFRLRGIEWTIVPFAFDDGSPWNVEHVTELAAPGTGIAPMARALASATRSRVIHVRHGSHTIHTEHGGIETHDDGDPLTDQALFVPPVRVRSDGYHVQLEICGVDASDVERVDLVVLQELGEPAIDRRTALPSAAPAVVGAPVLLSPNLPPVVTHAPELADGPPRTGAPPMAREAPPMVVIDEGPARSEGAPLTREAPPMLDVPETDPPDEAVAEPPLASAPTKSGPPPLVHAPPPMVTPDDGEQS